MATPHNRARLISVLLLGLTLAVGFMFGLAWDARQAADVVAVDETPESPSPRSRPRRPTPAAVAGP